MRSLAGGGPASGPPAPPVPAPPIPPRLTRDDDQAVTSRRVNVTAVAAVAAIR